MKHVFNIKDLDCASCASELEELLNDNPYVQNAEVSFMKQKVELECEEEHLLEIKEIINSFEEVSIIEDIQNYEYKICGLDCPNCALELQELISDIESVENAEVNFMKQKVKFSADQNKLEEIKKAINSFEEVRIVEEVEKTKHTDLILLIISAVIFLITFILNKINFNETIKTILLYVGYLSSYIIVGYEVLLKAIKSILRKNFFDENTLMTIASLAAIFITIFTKEFMLEEASMIMILYQLGEYLQKLATNSSRNQIKELVNLKAEEANLYVNNDIIKVDVEELHINDEILIKAGEKVPVDVIIIDGDSNFNGASLTGESEYQYFKTGDKVLSGYININKPVRAKVFNEYKDSAVKKIIDLVENTNDAKAKPEKFITKFARIYTPIVFLISFLICLFGVIYFLITKENHIVEYIIRGLTVLVISCPCALIISVPLTYFGGLGTSAKRGILIKGATNLDELANANMAIFDKTGTLTYGVFYVKEIVGENKELILKLTSSLEHKSNHPIANAFKEYERLEVTDLEEHIGLGLSGYIDNKLALVGNKKLMDKYDIKVSDNLEGTILHVAYQKEYLGYIILDDKERENIDEVFNTLDKLGVKDKVLLTGDNKKKALSFANKHTFTRVESELLPEQKFEIASLFSEEYNTIYVGDGINDAPVMNICNTSFSMGKLGSDLAIEVSDVVLVKDDLNGVCDAIKIAKKTKKIVLENIILSISFKVLVMILGFFGLVPLALAVFSDVGIMLLAVLNSLRIRHFK